MAHEWTCWLWRLVVIVAVVLGVTYLIAGSRLGAQAAAAPRFDRLVRADFFAGMSGDRDRLQKAMAVCEQALAANPKHAEAMVWHGAGTYYLAGQAFAAGDSEKGIELALRGQAEMDAAVALEPDNIGVLIPRGAALIEAARRMPADRARPLLVKAMGDYERTLEIQRGRFDGLGDHAKGELLFGLADGWSRLGDMGKARDYFELLTEKAPTSPRAVQARDRLAGGLAPTAPVAPCAGCHS